MATKVCFSEVKSCRIQLGDVVHNLKMKKNVRKSWTLTKGSDDSVVKRQLTDSRLCPDFLATSRRCPCGNIK